MYNYAVFCGRFQPVHMGHVKIIDEGLKQADKVIVLIGSANRSRSPKNPFTYSEREHLIQEIYKYEFSIGRLIILPVNDNMYNDVAWTTNVQRIVGTVIEENATVALLGFEKDYSSSYLKFFPTWEKLLVKTQNGLFNSTNVREDYFRPNPIISNISTPKETLDFLHEFIYSDAYKWIVEEKVYYDKYKALWKDAPFPVTINCADALVIQSGNILLVERKNNPGKGLLALPGGHVDPKEFLIDAAVRELREETVISDSRGEIPPGKLKSFIKHDKTKTYDHPDRSERGRVITELFHFEFPDTKDELYSVVGSDDAAKAEWYPLGSLKATDFFEDHAFIIMDQLGISMN